LRSVAAVGSSPKGSTATKRSSDDFIHRLHGLY
jgi:hypothetical protein